MKYHWFCLLSTSEIKPLTSKKIVFLSSSLFHFSVTLSVYRQMYSNSSSTGPLTVRGALSVSYHFRPSSNLSPFRSSSRRSSLERKCSTLFVSFSIESPRDKITRYVICEHSSFRDISRGYDESNFPSVLARLYPSNCISISEYRLRIRRPS